MMINTNTIFMNVNIKFICSGNPSPTYGLLESIFQKLDMPFCNIVCLGQTLTIFCQYWSIASCWLLATSY